MFKNKADKEKRAKEISSEIDEMASILQKENHYELPTDVLGSYTGTSHDGGSPTQDADDL